MLQVFAVIRGIADAYSKVARFKLDFGLWQN